MPAHIIVPQEGGGHMITSANRSTTWRHTQPGLRLWGRLDVLPNYLIKLSVKSSGGHSCSHHANCTPPQLQTSVALCCVTQLHILEWPFILPSTRYTCVMIMLFNQFIDMPHLSGGWIMLTNRDVNKFVQFVHNIWEISFVLMEHFWSLISAHKTWDQHLLWL